MCVPKMVSCFERVCAPRLIVFLSAWATPKTRVTALCVPTGLPARQGVVRDPTSSAVKKNTNNTERQCVLLARSRWHCYVPAPMPLESARVVPAPMPLE